MWKLLKKLLGWEQKQEQNRECGVKVAYVYPKTTLDIRPPRRKPRRDLVEQLSVKEWLRSCEEVDQLRRKLYA